MVVGNNEIFWVVNSRSTNAIKFNIRPKYNSRFNRLSIYTGIVQIWWVNSDNQHLIKLPQSVIQSLHSVAKVKLHQSNQVQQCVQLLFFWYKYPAEAIHARNHVLFKKYHRTKMGLLITYLAAALGLYYLRENEERLQAPFLGKHLQLSRETNFLLKARMNLSVSCQSKAAVSSCGMDWDYKIWRGLSTLCLSFAIKKVYESTIFYLFQVLNWKKLTCVYSWHKVLKLKWQERTFEQYVYSEMK